MYEKFKSFLANDTIFTAVLLVLVGVISFGLGRQSVLGSVVSQSAASHTAVSQTTQVTPGVVFTDAPPEADAAVDPSSPVVPPSMAGQVVGSRTGSKYHLPSCPGAKQIKEENKIFFESTTLAKAAGYTPAANCPGLE